MSLADLTKKIDIRFWRDSFTKLGLFQVMDQEAVDTFDRDLERVPPDFNMDNIRSTYLSMASDANTIFKRGIVNVFRRLSKEYKANSKEPFKVSEKAILNYMAKSNGRP